MIRFSKITHNVRDLFPKMTDYFASKSEIDFAYIFGSYGLGKETPLSDVDIAVYLNNQVPPDRFFTMRLSLITDLSRLVKTNEVDIVILNNASLLLAYQAVFSRTTIYEKNPTIRINFETQVLDRYFDMEPFRRVQIEYFKRHIETGKIFG